MQHPAFLCAVFIRFPFMRGVPGHSYPERGCRPLCARCGHGLYYGGFVGGLPLSLRGNKYHETGVNWRKIKAEYIAGGISQRALAEKYGLPQITLERRAKLEKWTTARREAEAKTIEKLSEKRADCVADNAVTLERIKGKLLGRLERMLDGYPDKDVAELRKKENGALLIYRMKDIAAVYSALEDKTIKANVSIEDLSPLAELLRDD